MSGELYRAAIVAILAVGITAGGIYLWKYRPTQWRSATTRDASGWVLMLWLYLCWAATRVLLGWHPDPKPVPLATALPLLAIGVGLDAVLVYRLRRFLQGLQAERNHPTRVCDCCQGRGVVPQPKEPA